VGHYSFAARRQRLTFFGVIFWVVALVFVSPFANPEIYRWVDQEGNVHYSDCPPEPTCDTEVIEDQPGPTKEEIAEAQARIDEIVEEAEQMRIARERLERTREIKRAQALRIAAQRRQDCLIAKRNLFALRENRAIFELDEQARPVYLSGEERESEIEKMLKLIKQNCTSR